jgi:acyl-CoA reductase-like NAD-dependent aldehyde dehydrogenase
MSDTLKTISPVDGRIYVERPLETAAGIDRALDSAAHAQPAWALLPLAGRCEILGRAVDAFVARASDIAAEITWQMGRPIRHAPWEIRGFEERARHMLGIAAQTLAEIHPGDKLGFERKIKRVPLGLVAVVAPWNYPYLTAVNAVLPALIAGNAVVLKHSAQTPLCAERFLEAFASAGVPVGVFQYLHLSHADTARLMGDARVASVCFTGSVAGGRAVVAATALGFATAGLELGGKDPAYVRADANLAHAVDTLTDGAFFNAGQSCCGIKRIYVAAPRYEEFRGARALIDESLFAASASGTPYLAPQVLVDVDHSMAIMREETFGPAVGIMKVASDAEALRLMNDSEFGLTAAIFSADTARAEALGDALETGTVFLNRCDYLDPALAWTGVKNSGRGCTLSSVGFEQLTRPKSYHFKVIT